MKTQSLLLLASLAVLGSGLRAAPSPVENETLVLPTYTVAAPRQLPAEQQVTASLDEFRRQATPAPAITAEFPALQALVKQDSTFVRQARDAKPVRLAKL